MIQKHVNKFRELKSPRKPAKPRLLTGKSEEAEATNLERQEKYDLKMNDWDKEDQRLEHFRSVYAIDESTAVFGSNFRVGRIKLPDTSAYQSENLPDVVNQLNKIVDSVQSGASYHEAVAFPTKELRSLLLPFVRETEIVKMFFEKDTLTVKPHQPASVKEATPLLLSLTYKDVGYVTEPFSFCINIRSFTEALKLALDLGHSRILLTCASPIKPIYLVAKDFEYLIAPVRTH